MHEGGENSPEGGGGGARDTRRTRVGIVSAGEGQARRTSIGVGYTSQPRRKGCVRTEDPAGASLTKKREAEGGGVREGSSESLG